MIIAFALALRQLADPKVLRILGKCVAVTLALFILLGGIGWWLLDRLLQSGGLDASHLPGGDGLRGVTALILVVIGGWLLWRIIALAVMQVYADEVVAAVEARHYPAALANVRKLGWRRELAIGLRGAGRSLLYNLAALPVALLLLVTGFGTAAVFLAVNAVLLGRELTEMVWLRHAHDPDAPLPLGRLQRFVFGGIVALLFIVPFANLLAPVIGAAMAAHLVHRSGALPHAS